MQTRLIKMVRNHELSMCFPQYYPRSTTHFEKKYRQNKLALVVQIYCKIRRFTTITMRTNMMFSGQIMAGAELFF